MHIINPLSTEFIRVPVAATENGAAIDVSLQDVEMAVIPTATQPVSGDWKSAEWETDSSAAPSTYHARMLVGPASSNITLTAGQIYDVFVRVTDNPEIPVRNAGAVVAF